MLKGQKLSYQGHEVMLFPLEYLYMTQDEGGDYSHKGTLSVDFAGWGKDGRIYKCPYYAPVTCKCIKSTGKDNRIFESVNPVYFNGQVDYLCWVQAHDDTPLPIGTIVNQGDVIGHTGTTGHVTGDHLHLNIARGKYAGWEQVPPNNNWQLKNSIHIYDTCYVNDTVLVRTFNKPWKEFTIIPPIPPFKYKKTKFKWVLYTNRFRERY